jgi:hypothetical protein
MPPAAIIGVGADFCRRAFIRNKTIVFLLHEHQQMNCDTICNAQKSGVATIAISLRGGRFHDIAVTVL